MSKGDVRGNWLSMVTGVVCMDDIPSSDDMVTWMFIVTDERSMISTDGEETSLSVVPKLSSGFLPSSMAPAMSWSTGTTLMLLKTDFPPQLRVRAGLLVTFSF